MNLLVSLVRLGWMDSQNSKRNLGGRPTLIPEIKFRAMVAKFIKTAAEECGVSHMTVRRALVNHFTKAKENAASKNEERQNESQLG